MVATASQPIDLVRGKPWKLPVQWRNPDGGGINIAGFTIAGRLRWSAGAVVLNVGNGGVVITDASAGQWEYRITDTTVTAQVPEGTLATLVIDITDAGGFVASSGLVPVKGVAL
jgi:hypothetical protein